MSKPIPRWEPLSEAVLADQRGTYDRMRASCPVAESPRGVTLFRHADVVASASDPATFSSAASAYRMVPNSLDPPEHTAFRAAIDPFFTPERMRALEPRLRRIAHEIVGALPRGAVVDAVTQIGYPFAVRAQADWLGWQGAEDRLLAWMAENHAATRSADGSRKAAVAAAFDEIVLAQVRDDPFLVSRRVVAVETQLAGFVLQPGTRVYLNQTSANRDETVFADPDAYRPEEHAPHNLVYGTVIHAFPGRPLATLELVVAVQTLLGMTTCIELAANAAAMRETYPLGGWRRVPVRLR